MFFSAPVKHSISILTFRFFMQTWLLLAPLATVNGQGGENKFPSPGAERQELPVGYGPHMIESNRAWIIDEAGLALAALHQKQAEAGLYNINEEDVGWTNPGELVIVPEQKWSRFERDLGADNSNEQYNHPLFNLLALGKRVTQMQSNIYRLFFIIQRAIVAMGLREPRELYEVFDLTYSLFTAQIRNRFLGNPKLLKRARDVLKPNSPVVAAALAAAAVDRPAREIFENMVKGAIRTMAAQSAAQLYLEFPGILDPGGILDSNLVNISKAGGFEDITTKDEKVVLFNLFDISAGSVQDKDIYINDGKFLLTWEIIYYAFIKVHGLTTALGMLLSPRINFYSKTFGELPKPARSLNVKKPGYINRRLFGTGGYIREKYGKSLIDFEPSDPRWGVWMKTVDKKYFSDILTHLITEMVVETQAALPAMLDCMADIAVQIHASGLPASSKLGPVPDFAIPTFLLANSTEQMSVDLSFFKNYPEFYARTSKYQVGRVAEEEPAAQNPDPTNQPQNLPAPEV
ncbi:hypothetical protein TWF191_007584 [Orbilia oligospora]|uniref:Uncharacterized protein n=2 Tax=Orbilia oligospora TaxID=2813651 RepID=A0A7C8UTZ5_ORBOL|nr:hypothetical protein TWF191_007584 [Orbilia oligospora]